MKYSCFFAVFLLFFFSCKKDKDIIKTVTVNGKIFNLCTDSVIAGVKVYFTTQNNGGIVSTLQTISASDGTFSFANVSEHSSSEFSYKIETENNSGIGGGTIKGIDGASTQLSAGELENYCTFYVVPKVYDLCFQISGVSTINSPDSIKIYAEQRKFHENVLSGVYQIGGNWATNVPTSLPSCVSNYPMGWWHITVDKIKGGNQTSTQDSIYIGWWAANTYTINW